jgi:hypothetical protein
MKWTKMLAGALLVLALCLALVAPASAAPVMPLLFSGNVTIGGVNAPIGTSITAEIEGTQVATATTTVVGKYVISIDYDSGYISKTVVLKVSGAVGGQGTYVDPMTIPVVNVNLTVDKGSPTSPVPQPPTTPDTTPTEARTISASILGHGSSFTINQSGVLTSPAVLTSADGKVQLGLNANTTINIQGQSLTVSAEPSAPAIPANVKLVNAYDFGPDNTSFDPAINLTFKYDLAALPSGVTESNLYIGFWNGSSWTDLPYKVNTEAKTVTAEVRHFTIMALLGKVSSAPPPAPASFTVSDLKISPTSVKPGEQVAITVTIANSGGTEGSYNAVLKINDVDEAQKQVTLGPKGKQEITFTTSQETAGSYDVNVGDTSGSFKVSMPDTASPGKKLSWPLVGGIAVVILLLIFLVIALLRRRAYNY